MTLQEKIVAILQARSFEIRDGASKMEVIEATDFDQISLDVLEMLLKDYTFDPEEKT